MQDKSKDLAAWVEQELQFNKTIGLYLRQWREESPHWRPGLLQELGISEQELRDWEAGRSSPVGWKYYALIKTLGEDAYAEASLLTCRLSTMAYRMSRQGRNLKD